MNQKFAYFILDPVCFCTISDSPFLQKYQFKCPCQARLQNTTWPQYFIISKIYNILFDALWQWVLHLSCWIIIIIPRLLSTLTEMTSIHKLITNMSFTFEFKSLWNCIGWFHSSINCTMHNYRSLTFIFKFIIASGMNLWLFFFISDGKFPSVRFINCEHGFMWKHEKTVDQDTN